MNGGHPLSFTGAVRAGPNLARDLKAGAFGIITFFELPLPPECVDFETPWIRSRPRLDDDPLTWYVGLNLIATQLAYEHSPQHASLARLLKARRGYGESRPELMEGDWEELLWMGAGRYLVSSTPATTSPRRPVSQLNSASSSERQ
jgi:hypothetical protein